MTDEFYSKFIAILRVKEARRCFGISRSHFYDLVSDGLIIEAVGISKRARGWPYYELEQILKAIISGKSEHEIRELVKKIKNQRVNLDGGN